jgi:hypothetical protein
MGLQERLLDDIGGVQCPTQSRIEVQTRQEPQVVVVLFQRARQPLVGVGHKVPYLQENAPGEKTHAIDEVFPRGYDCRSLPSARASRSCHDTRRGSPQRGAAPA